MRYIKKKKEPKSLTAKRNTEGACYDGPQLDWQEQLLDEQGYLCAYCMGRISLKLNKKFEPSIGIEHYLSEELCRQRGLDSELRWENMLGVCNGASGSSRSKFHCDKTNGTKKGKAYGNIELNILNPLDITKSEKLITYDLFGQILPNTKNDDLQQKIAEDLNCILNLNDEKLRQFRIDAMDLAKKILKEKYPTGNWTPKQIEKEIKEWKSKSKMLVKEIDGDSSKKAVIRRGGEYRAYCQAAIWFLEYLKSKPIHKS